MLGKYRIYEAWTCLKFYGWPDTLLGSKITRVLDASIQLRTTYHFGDSSANLPFSVYRAVSSWSGGSLALDSLQQRPTHYYDNSTPVTTQTVVGRGDTDWVTINIPDTALVRTWLTTNTDTVHLNDGLIFRPSNLKYSNVIKGFYSSYGSDTSLSPRLIIHYIDTSNYSGTYIHKTGISEYLAKAASSSLLAQPDALIYIQNGISYRGFINFDSVSINTPVLLYSAILEVTLNSHSSLLNSYTDDSFLARSVGTNDTIDGLTFSLSQSSTNSNSQKVYKINITSFLKLWMTNKSARKIALMGYAEYRAFDLFTLYGTDPSPAQKLRPRIIITYSMNR